MLDYLLHKIVFKSLISNKQNDNIYIYCSSHINGTSNYGKLHTFILEKY